MAVILILCMNERPGDAHHQSLMTWVSMEPECTVKSKIAEASSVHPNTRGWDGSKGRNCLLWPCIWSVACHKGPHFKGDTKRRCKVAWNSKKKKKSTCRLHTDAPQTVSKWSAPWGAATLAPSWMTKNTKMLAHNVMHTSALFTMSQTQTTRQKNGSTNARVFCNFQMLTSDKLEVKLTEKNQLLWA